MAIEQSHPNPSRARRRLAPLLALALVAAVLAGCQPQAPEERVAELRSEYSAELNSFTVQETPMVEESGMAAGEGEMEAAGEEADAAPEDAAGEAAGGEGTEEGIVEEVPVRQDVYLDVVLRKEGSIETLEGITLDVYHRDAEGNEKTSYRFYVETPRLNKGSRKQVTHVLQDVDYDEGDGFAVEVRQPIPPELYGEYKEFSELATEHAGE